LKDTAESTEEFLAKYPTVINYLKRKNPPTIIEIAKLTDCSKKYGSKSQK
jgi:hypothetical protein